MVKFFPICPDTLVQKVDFLFWLVEGGIQNWILKVDA